MEVVFARYTATVVTPDGAQRMVYRGEYWPASDPVVKAAPPDMFSTDPGDGSPSSSAPLDGQPVEQATAAPGEKRAAVRRG